MEPVWTSTLRGLGLHPARSMNAPLFGGQRGDVASRLPVQWVEVSHGALHRLVVEPGRAHLCLLLGREEYPARGWTPSCFSCDHQVAVQKPVKVSRPDTTVAHRLDLETWHDSLDRVDFAFRGRVVYVEHVEAGVAQAARHYAEQLRAVVRVDLGVRKRRERDPRADRGDGGL